MLYGEIITVHSQIHTHTHTTDKYIVWAEHGIVEC